MSNEDLRQKYMERSASFLEPVAQLLRSELKRLLEGIPRIDRITSRAKSVESFMRKATSVVDGGEKYEAPLEDIQDQIGARIVVFYRSDIRAIEERIGRYFGGIEERSVEPESVSAFGYEGTHYILFIPETVLREEHLGIDGPRVFELQIKTLFQYAWGQAGHDLAYKPLRPLSRDQNRRIAFAAAQAWGADRLFDELFQELGATEN